MFQIYIDNGWKEKQGNEKTKKQKNISFWIKMILNKQYFIHFGIKLFWLVCSVLYGEMGFQLSS